ncbi:MAG TPA: hypothetical protein DEG17_09290 [Cyanobacteria bacterium UBA11149]|nr:hypothetical protein [Cyanobacteria bacterium UBA11367]HBE57496.1 hypothetical protein [Cyanobacteria bacterium UBA11366]HBK66399.1 hypothetical protein [Cyanobacteria bacterium UBA11166]HBR73590.1 hypothetical protein [Cyanobacteria bacterium UBA11159]HBS68109.1 hypothetical protein [Cyanobacteria bacterium UBA11153]HBW89044.1 hypothetical protein [Cyanobacteria bacterium UBA11149]HCA96720.1 hypothetical protein [Cyanobacteria bacterium UBA9226]
MSGNYHFDLSKAKVGNVIAGDVHGNPTAIQIDCSPKQNLTEAAAEIQELIEQLARNYPTRTQSENKVVVAEAIEQAIAQNPTLKERLRGAFKAGGIEALKTIFNHPLISIPIETIKGWIEAE